MTAIQENVDRIAPEDLPKEIAFAKAALDEDHPATVYWLAALFARFEREVGKAWTYDKDDSTYDAPCPACGEGPLDLKGYGMVCPSGHIIEENA